MTKKLIKIEDDCFETYPCQHYVRFENEDGTLIRRIMWWPDIVKLAKESKYDLSHLRCLKFYEEINKEKKK